MQVERKGLQGSAMPIALKYRVQWKWCAMATAERAFCRLKDWCAIANRCDKTACNFLASIALGVAVPN